MSKFPKNASSTEKTAKSIDEAVELALTELGIEKENAEIEIVQEPSKGFLGIGAKDAVVKVTAKKDEKPAKTEKKQKAEKSETAEKTEKAPAKPKKAKTSGGVYNSDSPAENAKNRLVRRLTGRFSLFLCSRSLLLYILL